MSNLAPKGWISLAALVAVMGAIMFAAAGTARYWQAWAYLAIFAAQAALVTAYLLRKRSCAPRAPHAWRPIRGGTAGATDHHALRVAGFHQRTPRPGPRPPFWLVARADPTRRCWRCIGRDR